MTQDGRIPEDIDAFLRVHVESIDQLEILRVLGDSPGLDQSVADLARECQITLASVTSCLQSLEGRGLVKTQTVDAQLMCRIGPRTPEIEQQLTRLLQFYKERPVTLIKRIYAHSNSRLKAFADAFQFRKEP